MAKTYSDVARILGRRKSKYEKVLEDPDVTRREKNTAQRMLQRVEAQMDELFEAQQIENGDNGAEAPMMGYGGKLKKYAPGGRGPGDPPKRTFVKGVGYVNPPGVSPSPWRNAELPDYIKRDMGTTRLFGTVDWGGDEMRVMRTQFPDGEGGVMYKYEGITPDGKKMPLDEWHLQELRKRNRFFPGRFGKVFQHDREMLREADEIMRDTAPAPSDTPTVQAQPPVVQPRYIPNLDSLGAGIQPAANPQEVQALQIPQTQAQINPNAPVRANTDTIPYTEQPLSRMLTADRINPGVQINPAQLVQETVYDEYDYGTPGAQGAPVNISGAQRLPEGIRVQNGAYGPYYAINDGGSWRVASDLDISRAFQREGLEPSENVIAGTSRLRKEAGMDDMSVNQIAAEQARSGNQGSGLWNQLKNRGSQFVSGLASGLNNLDDRVNNAFGTDPNFVGRMIGIGSTAKDELAATGQIAKDAVVSAGDDLTDVARRNANDDYQPRSRSLGDNGPVRRMGNTTAQDFVRNTLRNPGYTEPTGPVIPNDPNANRVLPAPGDGSAPGRTSMAEQLGLAAPGTSNRVLPIPGQRQPRTGGGSRRQSTPSLFSMDSSGILKKALGMDQKDLRRLNRGDSTALQQALVDNGWELPKYGVDGSVGTETLGALGQLGDARPSDAMLQPLSMINTDGPAPLTLPNRETESPIAGNYQQKKGLLGSLRDMTSKENLRTARDIAGSVIPYAQYANAMKTARRMTPPPSPQYARAVPMQTDINVNDQLRAAREAERGFNRNVANNTTNSANANALRLTGLATRLRNEGGIRENERNMETQLGNQAAQVNAGVDQANTQLGNQYRGMRNDFNNNRQLFRNRAFQQLGNTALGQIMDSRMRQRDENVLQAYSKMFDGNLVYRNMADLAASDKTLQSLFGNQNPSDADRQKAIAYFKENGYSDEEIQEFLKLLKNG